MRAVSATLAAGRSEKKHITVAANDGTRLSLRVYERPGAPRIVISHGNGLAADGYRIFWEALADDFEIVTHDLRNHGRSERSSPERHCWSQIADDLDLVWRELARWLGDRTTIGVFHSLAAVASLHHLRRYGKGGDALLLFDPPLAPPASHPLAPLHAANMTTLASIAGARNALFASPRQLADKFARQGALKRWRHEAYEAMANATLRRHDEGAWRLSCPPTFEASIFATNTDASLWETLRHAPIPIKLVGGDPTLPGATASVLMGRSASSELGLEYEAVPNTTHFLQLEEPEACRVITRAYVNALGSKACA
ncbi:MAG TPA: alpha/beta hydrolase [Casimicrobiaceae bacterium]|nr:alpha/beta hydrolase [Casimicrobiaceae bacterium]